MKKVQTAVIGYGFAGRSFHSYLVGLVPDMTLRGICTGNPERQTQARAERSCRIYREFQEVLDDDGVDLVVLATPNATHCELAVRALDAGKNVVTDKIMCLNLGEYRQMTEAAERNGKLLSVFQNRRWDGDYLTLKKVMEDGLLGDVRHLEMAWQGLGAWAGRWRGEKQAGGGKLNDLGAHLIDQICQLFPEPLESVYAKLQYDWPQCDVESHALVVINFEGGRTAVCDTSSIAAISKPRMYALGKEGAFCKCGLDPQEQAMKDGNIDAAVEPEENYATVKTGDGEQRCPTIPGRWRCYYENIADVLLNGAELAVTPASVRRSIAVIDAAFRSSETDSVVRF